MKISIILKMIKMNKDTKMIKNDSREQIVWQVNPNNLGWVVGFWIEYK